MGTNEDGLDAKSELLPEEVEELFELSEKEQAEIITAAVKMAMCKSNLVMLYFLCLGLFRK